MDFFNGISVVYGNIYGISIQYLGKFDKTTEACSPSLESIVYSREIITLYGRKIQASEVI